MKSKVIFLISAIFIAVTIVIADSIWKINSAESYIAFSTKAVFGKVKGKIPNISGDIKFDENDLENSAFDTWIGPADLNTENSKRDKHLKSDAFLDVVKFPKVKFKSKKIEKKGNGYSVTGDLTIKETTKEVTFPFTFEKSGGKGTFKGSFTINRLDYKVGKESKLAGNNVDIEIATVVHQ